MGHRGARVLTDIPLEKLAQSTGAISISLLFLPLERQTEETLHTDDHTEIETLLAFLETAFSPGAVATSEKKDQEEER